jgi:hypothetical protein
MNEYIRITLAFTRTEDKDCYSNEDYTHCFNHSDEDAYDGILEKMQTMLEAMGYLFGKKVLMAVDPNEVISDIAPTRPFSVVRNPDDE